jgi:GGDEF domain-containing protein
MDRAQWEPMYERDWQLLAPISIEGSNLIVEYCELEGHIAIRLGGFAGVVLPLSEFELLIQHIGSGRGWNSNGVRWAPPLLQVGARSFTLKDAGKRALMESLARIPGPAAAQVLQPEVNPWQRKLVRLLHEPLEGLQPALSQLATLAHERLDIQGLSLWLHNPAASSFTLAARVPKLLEPGVLSQRDYLDLLEQCLLLPVHDLQADARMAALRPIGEAWYFNALLQVPIRLEREVSALLWLERREPQPWSELEQLIALQLAEALRPHVAVSLAQGHQPGSLEAFKRYLEQAVAQARQQGHPVGLIWFKSPNLSEVQRARVLDVLRRSLRHSDAAIEASPEDFLLLLSTMRTPEGAAKAAERIVARLQIVMGKLPALGIAVFPDQATSAEELWQQAGLAAGKALGGGGGGGLVQVD